MQISEKERFLSVFHKIKSFPNIGTDTIALAGFKLQTAAEAAITQSAQHHSRHS